MVKIKEKLNKPITLTNLICVVLVLILLVSAVYFCVKHFTVQKELNQARTALELQTTNEKVLDFTKLFIAEVLKADNEVDFETRLKLENAVRNLEDEEILAQWQKFTESKNEIDAQEQVKNLLEMLVNKIEVK